MFYYVTLLICTVMFLAHEITVFFHFPFLPAFLCQTFLAFISAPTGFLDWGLVTRWARLLITLLTATYPAHRKIEV